MSIILLLGRKSEIWGIMLNGINNTDLEKSNSGLLGVNSVVTNPISNPYKNIDRNLLIDETAISDTAINLYQKEQDVNKFTKLMMSDPNDLSHEDIISGLFDKGIIDPFSDEAIEELSTNKNLLKDLDISL